MSYSILFYSEWSSFLSCCSTCMEQSVNCNKFRDFSEHLQRTSCFIKYSLQKQLYSMKTALSTVSPKPGHCEQQWINGHACTFTTSNQPAQKILISARYGEAMFQIWWRWVHKSCEILTTDAGHRTPETRHISDFTFCPLHWTDNNEYDNKMTNCSVRQQMLVLYIIQW